VLQNQGVSNNQEDPLQRNSLKAHIIRFFSWISGMDRFEHLHRRQ